MLQLDMNSLPRLPSLLTPITLCVCLDAVVFLFRPASHAVDGDDDPDLYHNKCTHTNQENAPWFVVDLGKAFSIVGVAIVNRGDEHSRLSSFFL